MKQKKADLREYVSPYGNIGWYIPGEEPWDWISRAEKKKAARKKRHELRDAVRGTP